jgi:hypothetical protein
VGVLGVGADDKIPVGPSVAPGRTAVVNGTTAGEGWAEHPASSTTMEPARKATTAVRFGGGWLTAAPEVDTQRRIHRE